MASPPLIVLLDSNDRYARAAVLKSRGYGVFVTAHVVEACLRWSQRNCAALIIGPRMRWHEVATVCEWIKTNSPEKPIILLRDRRNARAPSHVDSIVLAQSIHALLDTLRVLLAWNEERDPTSAMCGKHSA